MKVQATHVETTGWGGSAADRPRNLAEAAGQFESLLIGQMLKTMRESSSGGWMGSGGDQSSASLTEFAEEHFARTIAQNGGLGLTNIITAQLSRGPGAAGYAVDQAINASSSEESPADAALRALPQASHP
jgi:Rod binding domain-containing protein